MKSKEKTNDEMEPSTSTMIMMVIARFKSLERISISMIVQGLRLRNGNLIAINNEFSSEYRNCVEGQKETSEACDHLN